VVTQVPKSRNASDGPAGVKNLETKNASGSEAYRELRSETSYKNRSDTPVEEIPARIPVDTTKPPLVRWAWVIY